jgi:D-arabinose 1-dehydrogenase-like Zn-dependent alcohol dehydrogenase
VGSGSIETASVFVDKLIEADISAKIYGNYAGVCDTDLFLFKGALIGPIWGYGNGHSIFTMYSLGCI